MKKYALIIAIWLCPCLPGYPIIVNGFLREKLILEKETRNRVELLNKDASEKATRQFEKNLRQLRKKYAEVVTKYNATNHLLQLIEFIDPVLYENVSNVKNADGTLTNVYVNYVNRTSEEFKYYANKYFKAKAFTSESQAEHNKNVCSSLYGTILVY